MDNPQNPRASIVGAIKEIFYKAYEISAEIEKKISAIPQQDLSQPTDFSGWDVEEMQKRLCHNKRILAINDKIFKLDPQFNKAITKTLRLVDQIAALEFQAAHLNQAQPKAKTSTERRSFSMTPGKLAKLSKLTSSKQS